MKTFYKSVAVLFMLLLLQADLFARGGGGGHGGGHGGGGGHSSGGYHGGGAHSGGSHNSGIGDLYAFLFIAGVIGVVLISSRYGHHLLVRIKSRKAAKQIKQSAIIDPLWSPEFLEKFTREVFLRIQKAWMEQDMSSVKDITSAALRRRFQEQLDVQRVKKIYNEIKDVRIHEIKFVGATDFHNNTFDTYVAYIKGTITDNLVYKETGLIKSYGDSSFEDLYYFKRTQKNWYLVDIDNEVRFKNLQLILVSSNVIP